MGVRLEAAEVKVVEKELERMQKAYENAQERYAYGSNGASRTMEKYRVLMSVLESALAPSREDKLQRMVQGAIRELSRQNMKGRLHDDAYRAIRGELMEGECDA